MDENVSGKDDESFVVLGLGSMPPASLEANMLSEQRALDSLTNYDANSCVVQVKLDQLLRENCMLRDALHQNNLAMKTQFDDLSKWQQEVSKTHRSHKEKFEETKALVMKLKAENASLKSNTGRKCEDVESINSEIFSLKRRNDQLMAENKVLVKERDSFREECTNLTLKIADLELIVRRKTEALDESLQNCRQPRHPLSIEVDYPMVPDISFVKVENEMIDEQHLLVKYNNQLAEMKAKEEAHLAEIEEKENEILKLKSELSTKDSYLKTTMSELLREKDLNQELVTKCEQIGYLQNQVEVYKNDYREERQDREKLATEKENLATELRILKEKISRLEAKGSQVKNTDPEPCSSTSEEVVTPINSAEIPTAPVTPFACPVCSLKFADIKDCENHVNICLDRHMDMEL